MDALPPGDLPNPGIEFTSPVSLALQADSLPLSFWGSPPNMLNKYNSINKFALGSLILKELINYSLREEYTGFNTYLKKQILETSIHAKKNVYYYYTSACIIVSKVFKTPII